MNLHWYIITTQSPQFTCELTPGILCFMNLGKYMQHASIIIVSHIEYFHCPKHSLCSAYSSLPPFTSSPTTDLFTVSIVLPFPEYHFAVRTTDSKGSAKCFLEVSTPVNTYWQCWWLCLWQQRWWKSTTCCWTGWCLDCFLGPGLRQCQILAQIELSLVQKVTLKDYWLLSEHQEYPNVFLCFISINVLQDI